VGYSRDETTRFKKDEVQESAEKQASTYSHLDEEVELCDSSAAVGLVSVSCPLEVSTRNPVSIVIGKIIGILRGLVRAEVTTGRNLMASSTRRGR